jgi:hypothetical protein
VPLRMQRFDRRLRPGIGHAANGSGSRLLNSRENEYC